MLTDSSKSQSLGGVSCLKYSLILERRLLEYFFAFGFGEFDVPLGQILENSSLSHLKLLAAIMNVIDSAVHQRF